MGEVLDVSPAADADVNITEELLRRAPSVPDYLREKVALQDLADQMAEDPAALLPRLVNQAMEICEADSAGISVLEEDTFYWLGLAGKLAAFEGTHTPRNFSPCGICIDNRHAILMKEPERVYQWIADAKITIPEVLLVPLFVHGVPLGTLWIVAKEGRQFNSGHQRIMTELAAFTGAALRMVQSDARLRQALDEQEILTKEMSHRLKNVFAVTDAMVRMTGRESSTKQQMIESLTGRLRALSDAHGLVRRSLNDDMEKRVVVDLHELIEIIFRPYRAPHLNGSAIQLGEHTTNSVALVLHELATNAAKYGALSTDNGTVGISWEIEDTKLIVRWHEQGGSSVTPPVKKGFGSTLIERTMAADGGQLHYDWSPQGVNVRIEIPADRLTL